LLSGLKEIQMALSHIELEKQQIEDDYPFVPQLNI
jgi:hypothetical protein